jgi:hypothetical protein
LDVLYELSSLYQMRDDADEAISYLKEIYAIDASYRDVGTLLDEYVRQRDGAGTAVEAPDGENPK